MASKRTIDLISTTAEKEIICLDSPPYSPAPEDPKEHKLIVVSPERKNFTPDPEESDPKSPKFSFFTWKNYDKEYYFISDFHKECEYAKNAAIRAIAYLDNEIKWPQFARIVLSVGHFIALASNNYRSEPFAHPFHSRKERNLPETRHVLFGELFVALCTSQIEDRRYAKLLTGLTYRPDIDRYTLRTAQHYSVPKSYLQTSFSILFEALSFLINIGLVEVSVASLLPI